MFAIRKIIMGHVVLTTPLLGVACHPGTRTCYGQPAYQTWSLYPTTRYDDMKGNTKCGNGLVWGS